MRLTPGQKTPLKALNITTRMTIDVDYGVDGVDIVLFGLDGSKKIADDRYTVLFSNTSTPDGAIRLRTQGMTTSFDVDLAAVPASIDRLMVVASHDDLALSSAKPLVATIGDASFDAGTVAGQERAIMLVEIYRHNGEWRLSANGQGFNQGLAKLIEHLGGDVSSGADAQPAMDRRSPAPTPHARTTTPAPPPAPPAAAPISLSKITLEKQKSVSLEKKGASFGDIILNLNWAQGKSGFFGSRQTLDLDLGCLFEMNDGHKGVVQALGNAFGDYEYEPYIELDGDDRSGSNVAGETIRINGRRFENIKRIAVFAFIYEGAVKWNQTDATATIKMPGQPEVVVEIRDGNDRERLYGVAIIENDRGTMRITNHARSYQDQKKFAEAVGIHLKWVEGRKD